jgi:hypothetical protein
MPSPSPSRFSGGAAATAIAKCEPKNSAHQYAKVSRGANVSSSCIPFDSVLLVLLPTLQFRKGEATTKFPGTGFSGRSENQTFPKNRFLENFMNGKAHETHESRGVDSCVSWALPLPFPTSLKSLIPDHPVCERRVNLLVCSLPLHRHSYLGFNSLRHHQFIY